MSNPGNSDPTQWVKASASSSDGNCVEMREHGDVVEVRDTKQKGQGPTLGFTRAEFAAWLDGAKRGEFDHLG
ncbi:MAG TPA: DUF397 domain-containing protein [Kineosporiaceae bacterium]|nr:DUF397 domain-containing protein [Kineosporiaceae bacterium]